MYAEPGQRVTILTFASNKLARGASISTHVSELSEDKVLRAAMQFNLINLPPKAVDSSSHPQREQKIGVWPSPLGLQSFPQLLQLLDVFVIDENITSGTETPHNEQ